jgi:2-keto-4-pentenoate hydratase
MYFELREKTAEILARSRRLMQLCDLPLDLITSESEACELQEAAQDALGFERRGYAVVGSSPATRGTLGLSKPIYSAIPASALFMNSKGLRLAPGVIGAQCEFVFTMLRPYPDGNEAIDRASAADAVVGCQPAIGLVGRRTHHSYAGENAAIADFGLHVATLCGKFAEDVDFNELAKTEVNVFLFKETVFSGSAASIMGHPLEAIVWLARELARRGKRLEPDDIVTTGSCTTILQVLPGQHMAADFGPLGQVECIFA